VYTLQEITGYGPNAAVCGLWHCAAVAVSHSQKLPRALPYTTKRTATHYQAHYHTTMCALPYTAACTSAHCHTLLPRIAAHYAALPDSLFYFILFYLFYVTLLYFHNTHQVLVGLPQGVDGLGILFVLISFHSISFLFIFITLEQVLVGHPQGVSGLAVLLYTFLFLKSLFHFSLFL
jgi:hypothetical protein